MRRVLGLPVVAARRERRRDRAAITPADDGSVRACGVDELVEGRGRSVWLGTSRVALFRHEHRFYAISNVCRHQGGPLGEGRILDGCVTCPWHGWQYRPADGCSPPPFTERVETYRVRVASGGVWVHPRPDPPGTPQAGAPAPPVAARGPSEEFYVGYLPHAPQGLARRLRRTAFALAVATPIVVGLAAAVQGRLPPGTFEFGRKRTFEGVLYETPVPLLHALDAEGVPAGVRNLLLTGSGKFGLPSFARGHHGRKVRFRGSLIHHAGTAMVELNDPASFEDLGAPAAGEGRRPSETIGTVTLAGELVDSKCWLGVMRPATGKVHRACAVRCLAGGVPPALMWREPHGETRVVLLAAADGGRLGIDPELAGRRLRVSGVLEMHEELSVLRVAGTDQVALDGSGD
jgi:nitrite reductase/ring-hydroxylating ferredoxin subunit